MQEDKTFEILVVDDEPPICELLSRLANELFPEASFINTRSAQETLSYLDEQSQKLPKLVLLDIDLGPSINGIDLIPKLNNSLQSRVPIIMLSSSIESPTVKRAYEKGAVAYTQKPEDLQGWKNYVANLRSYWYDTTILPTTAQP